ncbi:MAG: Cache 3/Cache 2 fusion domain-containing protein [Thermodesulfobacteriota bacterium]
MIQSLSLRARLLILFTALICFSVVLVGLFSFFQFRSFGSSTLSVTRNALTEQAVEVLEAGVNYDRQTVRGLIDTAARDAWRLASSSNACGYFAAKTGRNEILNRMIESEARNTVQGVSHICRVQHELVRENTEKAMEMARYVLDARAGIEVTGLSYTWNAADLYTGETAQAALPVLQIGFDPIVPYDPAGQTHYVDTVRQVTGSACAVFQKMNSEWDMLIIAASVDSKSGEDLHGRFLPADTPDQGPSPVIAAVRRGEPYRGNIDIGGKSFIGAFTPLRDDSDEIIGMLFTGSDTGGFSKLKETILDTTLGKTGYAAVMAPDGRLIVHPRADVEGLNVISDLHIPEFQTVLDNYRTQRTGLISYTFEDRRKFLAYAYFDPWDWIILATGYWDEFSQEDTAHELLQDEIQAIFGIARQEINGRPRDLYRRIRCIGADGSVSLTLTADSDSAEIPSPGGIPDSEAMEILKDKSIYYSPIQSGKSGDILTVAAPIFLDQEFVGAMAVEFNWDLIWESLRNRVYGKTGYAYIINPEGILVSHPKYRLADGVNIGNAEYGEMADLVNRKMRKGESGDGIYTFEGIEKHVYFKPLRIGDAIYSFAVTSPVSEFYELAAVIEGKAGTSLQNGMKILVLVGLGLLGIGLLLAFRSSSGIARPLTAIIDGLTRSADQIDRSSYQLADAGQQLAEGASEQAASLEQTSASLEEMSATIQQNAEHALETDRRMQDTRRTVEGATGIMEKLVAAMSDIAGAGEASSKIIQTSEDIAFQTNLLALNAAVEAARAGQAGAGFAVVAEEVRRLALRAGEASRSTSELVQSIVDRLQEGTDLVKRTDDAFRKIEASASEMADRIGDIAAASGEQAKSIEQLTITMSEMDKLTQQNAAGADASASASDQMRSQAERMQTFVEDLVKLVQGKER